jgi:hypothetical protein
MTSTYCIVSSHSLTLKYSHMASVFPKHHAGVTVPVAAHELLHGARILAEAVQVVPGQFGELCARGK